MSVDDGANFFESSGDYKELHDIDEIARNSFATHGATGSAGARGFVSVIHGASFDGPPKMATRGEQGQRIFVGSGSPINAVRIQNAVASGPEGDFTGGEISVYVRS